MSLDFYVVAEGPAGPRSTPSTPAPPIAARITKQHQMAPSKTTAQQSINLPYIDPKNPIWDSSPITKGLWFFALEEHLYSLDG